MIVCAECGSKKVQTKAWVDVNTNEYQSETDDGVFFCCDCEEMVDVEDE